MSCLNTTRKKSGRTAPQAGTTLVEVMLTVALIAIMAVVVITSLMYPTQLVVSDARRQIALLESGRDMEEVANMTYNNISSTNYTITALHEALTVNRTVVSNLNEKVITVVIQNSNNEQIVELVTERTP